MSKTALVRFGAVAIPEMLARVGPERNLYDHCRLSNGARVFVDHDHDRPVGRIRQLTRSDDYDGLWHAALLDIDYAPDWLKRGTPVSVAGNTFARGTLFGREITRGLLVKEISLVSPACEPLEPMARVLTLRAVEVEQPSAPQAAAPDVGAQAPVRGAPARQVASPPRTRSGQIDELAWVDYLVEREGWDVEDAINAVRVVCGYHPSYLDPNRRRRIQIAA